MDHATLLAENQERERQFRLQLAMQVAPPWPVREDSVVPFAWPHTARRLIAERKCVLEILQLRATIENVSMAQSQPNFGVPISFHESFVCSDDERVMLMFRVRKHYDTYWQPSIVATHLNAFPQSNPGHLQNEAAIKSAVSRWSDNVASQYGLATIFMTRHIETLLHMQALCEELAPETRELVSRCSSYEQLDRSMLTMQSMQEAIAFHEGFAFRAPCASLFTTPNAFL
jgi:hypothetical protein